MADHISGLIKDVPIFKLSIDYFLRETFIGLKKVLAHPFIFLFGINMQAGYVFRNIRVLAANSSPSIFRHSNEN